MPVNTKRIRTLVKIGQKKGPVVYWMSRDQRVNDNWALLYAQELAQKHNCPLVVAFCLVSEFLGAVSRQYRFMLQGLKEVEKNLLDLNIPFFLLRGDPGKEMACFLSEMGAGALVSDFSPLRQSQQWKSAVAVQIEIPFYEVDAHNIIPCWFASQKQEWAAYSFRPKIHRLLSEFLDEFPALQKSQKSNSLFGNGVKENDWQAAKRSIRTDDDIDAFPDANRILPGEAAAIKLLINFLEHNLASYETKRNDPNKGGQSGLSPYLHFGQISSQRVAQEVLRSMKEAGAFLEELIVRKELSDNFCYYSRHYDDMQSFPAWARASLSEHEKDRREYLYTLQELERARTHDDLWNAASQEMLLTGKMHGYMRMYWAKKILEWTPSPAAALQAAIYLNDRYELDGRDPNGYVGIAWSLGGVHDRAWKERPIFGKVRYMSYNGAKSKFDVQAYINTWNSALELNTQRE
ncbi:MAG: deoxyribodipyrimidine photo-lyase [Methanotrichaceae archaeon]|nr:deoxyribodipyrimidine photo-lyase [Methanotrichaceae archaeon]